MKTNFIITAIFCLVAKSLFAQSNLIIDTKNSVINWTGHAELGTYAPAGTLNFKDESTIQTKDAIITGALLVIDMKSMKQENENLLSHLKSEDFFDVEKYTLSTLKIERITNDIAYGHLTIKDKTLPFQCAVTVKKENNHYIISGNTTIDRTKFGIIYNSGNFFSGLGDKAIRNTFDINFKLITN